MRAVFVHKITAQPPPKRKRKTQRCGPNRSVGQCTPLNAKQLSGIFPELTVNDVINWRVREIVCMRGANVKGVISPST